MIRIIFSTFLLGCLCAFVEPASIRANVCNETCMMFHRQNRTYCEKYCRVSEDDASNPPPNLKEGFNIRAVQAIGHFVWGLVKDFGLLMKELVGLVMPFGGERPEMKGKRRF